jgi:ubiquinol-cytochrome c reductase cytochrome b subunit
VPRKGYRIDKIRQRMSRAFFEDRIEPVTPAELAAAHSHGSHDALEADHGPAVRELEGTATGGGRTLAEPADGSPPDARNR